jgi:hypothetical protein
VIAVDTNILVYAFRESSPFHMAALSCLKRLAEGSHSWAVPWPCVHEFVAIVTHPRIPPAPAKLVDALAAVEAWMSSPSVVLLCESPAHWSTLKDLLESSQVQGPVVHDARVAALCVQHGVRELWSADRDFGRFAGLTVVNPLVAPIRR